MLQCIYGLSATTTQSPSRVEYRDKEKLESFGNLDQHHTLGS